MLKAYVVGAVLSVGVPLFARSTGLDRGRAFYSTLLIVVGHYYVLFAAVGASLETVLLESIGLAAFTIVAVIGFRSSSWILAGGLAAHGLFDALHGRVLENPGVPAWWPAFCLTFDVGAAACLAWLTAFAPKPARPEGAPTLTV